MTWTYNASPELDATSRWPRLVGSAIALTTVMSIVVALRLLCRWRLLNAEDYIATSAGVFAIGYQATNIMRQSPHIAHYRGIPRGAAVGLIRIETRYGLGIPDPMQIPLLDLQPYLTYNYAGRPLYVLGICLFKIALCLSYLRFTKRATTHTFRWGVHAVMAYVLVTTFITLCLNFFGCTPLAKTLHPEVPGKCINFDASSYYISTTMIIADLMVFLLPIQLMRSLSLSKKKKVQICLVFGLGLITTVFSVLRLYATTTWDNGAGDALPLVLYSGLEVNVGVLTSSLPYLRSLIDRKHGSSNDQNYKPKSQTAEHTFTPGAPGNPFGSYLDTDKADSEESMLMRMQFIHDPYPTEAELESPVSPIQRPNTALTNGMRFEMSQFNNPARPGTAF